MSYKEPGGAKKSVGVKEWRCTTRPAAAQGALSATSAREQSRAVARRLGSGLMVMYHPQMPLLHPPLGHQVLATQIVADQILSQPPEPAPGRETRERQQPPRTRIRIQSGRRTRSRRISKSPCTCT